MRKIDELPVEMLMKVFSYLPNYDAVSLVNKLFYNVACKLTDAGDYVKFSSIFLVSKKIIFGLNYTSPASSRDTKKIGGRKAAIDMFVCTCSGCVCLDIQHKLNKAPNFNLIDVAARYSIECLNSLR